MDHFLMKNKSNCTQSVRSRSLTFPFFSFSFLIGCKSEFLACPRIHLAKEPEHQRDESRCLQKSEMLTNRSVLKSFVLTADDVYLVLKREQTLHSDYPPIRICISGEGGRKSSRERTPGSRARAPVDSFLTSALHPKLLLHSQSPSHPHPPNLPVLFLSAAMICFL